MAKGWVSLDRSLLDHWIWSVRTPYDERSAWVDLLLMANHKAFKATRRGKIVQRKRGEVNTSTVFLADRWHWSRGKVNRFLKMLESDGMISICGTTDGTTITVENYDKFQRSRTANGQQTVQHTDSPRTAHGTHDNNVNNGNNVNNVNTNKYGAVSGQLEKTLEDFEEMRKRIKAPMTDRARQLLMSRLKKLSGGDETTMIAILEQSIVNSWKGVYEIKDGYKDADSGSDAAGGTPDGWESIFGGR